MRRAAEHEDEPPAATQQVGERRALGVRDRRLEREAEVRRLQHLEISCRIRPGVLITNE